MAERSRSRTITAKPSWNDINRIAGKSHPKVKILKQVEQPTLIGSETHCVLVYKNKVYDSNDYFLSPAAYDFKIAGLERPLLLRQTPIQGLTEDTRFGPGACNIISQCIALVFKDPTFKTVEEANSYLLTVDGEELLNRYLKIEPYKSKKFEFRL